MATREINTVVGEDKIGKGTERRPDGAEVEKGQIILTLESRLILGGVISH